MLIFLAALIAGPVFLISGIREYKDSKQLQANGKVATAEVVKAEEAVSRKGRHTYYLTIQFTPEQGQAQTARRSVSSERFNRAIAEKAIGLVYLPSKPSVFQFGDTAETRYGSIVVGSICLVGALGFVAYFWLTYRSSRQGQGLSASPPQSVPATDQQKAA